MDRKNSAESRRNSTKQPPSATGGRLTRLVQALALLAVFKLAVISLLLVTPYAAQGPILDPVIVRSALAASPGPNTQVPGNVTTGPENATAAQAQTPQPQDQNTREQTLDKREADLKALEMELNEKLVRLRELEVKMQGLIDAAAAIRDEKMAHLIDVYSNMKPKQAAQVLGTLEDATAVKILAGMTGRKAGEILSSVRADRAAKLSEALTRMQTSETGK